MKKVNEIYDEIGVRLPRKCTEVVARYLIEKCEGYIMDLEQWTEKCESPIEEILVMELKDYIDSYHGEIHCRITKKGDDFITGIPIEMEVQKEILGYRVDILVYFDYEHRDKYELPKTKGLIIECDGFEYHHKTPEAVIKDNKRQQRLELEGYQFIRFLGTEIINDPYECCDRIYNKLENIYEREVSE